MVASAGSRSGRAPILAKYDVLDELGHGGMATVYRAHDKRLARDVAIKVLHPHLRESREIAHRFSVEAKAVAKLRHPNIVEVFDVSSEEENEQYLVVELVRGPTLRKILQDRGAIPPEIAASIVMELLGGIVHAHTSGVVHRDVKPENVLIEHRKLPSKDDSAPSSQRGDALARHSTPIPTSAGTNSLAPASGGAKSKRGERAAVKLTDFGIAKLLDAQGVTSTGQVLGSPAHMAPEQIEGGDVDGRADVFGLGVLLYECMVGHLPFLGNNPAQVLRRVLDGIYASAERERATVGKVWSQIIDNALARKAEARYADAATMREAIGSELERLGMGEPRVEIEAWLDDPEAWSAAHEKRIIERLCALGAASRKRSNTIAAAADYNRALAYAPNDPQLLKVVVSMQRSEARALLIKRIAPLVLAAAVLGPGAYFTAKAFKGSPIDPLAPKPSANPSASVASQPSSIAPKPTASEASSTTPVPTGVTTRVTANPVVVPSTSSSAKPGAMRNVTFTSIRPSFGVRVSIDGESPMAVGLETKLPLDNKAHTLVFTCEKNLCTQRTIPVAASDKDEALGIELAVAPAKLIVDGDPTHTYGIEELPRLSLSPGKEVDIEMTAGSGNRTIQIYDNFDKDQKKSVTLVAGERKVVSFKTP